MKAFFQAIINFFKRKTPPETPVVIKPIEPVKPQPPKPVQNDYLTLAETEDFLRLFLVSLWLEDLGKRETKGQNRADWIDDINRQMGVDVGEPYCISGLLIRGVKRLCLKFNLKNPVTMTSSTQRFFQRSEILAPKFVITKGSGVLAKKGCIGILRQRTDMTKGHAFGFKQDEGSRGQITIEYNTNTGGSRNGDGVYSITRTQNGTSTKEYLGAVDVVAWILSANKDFKIKRSDAKLNIT